MKFSPMAIPEVLLVEQDVHGDERGFFMETWRADLFEAAGIKATFVQDSHSRSRRGVLRGLHYQVVQAQGKLLRVVLGSVFDVAVDMRASGPTFGRWIGQILSAENKLALWIPPGFAHGFCVTSDSADLVYKCTEYYAPVHERTLLWNDPAVGIEWPLVDRAPILSAKDQAGLTLDRAAHYA